MIKKQNKKKMKNRRRRSRSYLCLLVTLFWQQNIGLSLSIVAQGAIRARQKLSQENEELHRYGRPNRLE